MDIKSKGQIITFYSYKGGTGRSMSLANIAFLLAEQQSRADGKGVLMIDWDLEAPGLHRYFQDKLASRSYSSEDNYDAAPGLIDLFYKLNEEMANLESKQETNSSSPKQTLKGEAAARQIIENVNLEKYVLSTRFDNLSLLKAGRFNSADTNEYSQRVNKFNWEALYQKSPHLLRVFAETLAEKYAYVLIDSRTGITDVSGICTMILPEKLVVVFTPNMQSLRGVLDIVRRATDYRKESGDLRPLVVYPLVSRVESNEPELRHDWRFGDDGLKITGYQPEFEKVLADVYKKERVSLHTYFDEMQIQHIPKYAYGEEIAVLTEKTDDKFSLRRSYRTFTDKLVESKLPWEGEINLSDSYDDSKKLIPFAINYFEHHQKRIFVITIIILTMLVSFLASSAYYSNQQQITLTQQKEEAEVRASSAETKIVSYKIDNENSAAEIANLKKEKASLLQEVSKKNQTTCKASSNAVALTNNIVVRDAPRLNAQKINELRRGQKVYVSDCSENYDLWNDLTGNWANIETEDKKRGWVFSPFISSQAQVKQ